MLEAVIHGRAGADPRESATKTGNAMTTLNVAVDVTDRDKPEETLWVTVLAFGTMAARLATAGKGDPVTAMGRLTASRYTPPDGPERLSWSIVASAVLTPQVGPAKAKEEGRASRSSPRAPRASSPPITHAPPADAMPFDDEIPF